MHENRICIYSFLIIAFLIQSSNNYLIFPFKTTKIPFKEQENSDIKTIENFLSQININQLYTTVSFGNPPRNIDCYLSFEQSVFSILSNNCLKGSESSYDPKFSSKFKNQSSYHISVGKVRKACLANDECTFYNDIKLAKNSSFNDFLFLLGNNSSPEDEIFVDSDRLCGTVGLMRYSYNTDYTINNLVYYLKQNKVIDSYTFGIYYFDSENSLDLPQDIRDKYEGYLIVGISNSAYLDIFKTDEVYNSYLSSTISWSIKFNKIFFNDSQSEYMCSNDTSIYFMLDYNYISCDEQYYNNIKNYFFKSYLEKNICTIESTSVTYEGNNYMIVCNSEIKNNLTSFPKIYFYSHDLSFTFNLDYNDLFFEHENKIYFLVIYKQTLKTIWNVGKIFLKKYPFIFDFEKKMMSFVHLDKYGNSKKESKNDEKNNYSLWEKIKIYVFIFLLIIAVIIGVIIGKLIWKKQRKTRANELVDNYEYIEKFDINK